MKLSCKQSKPDHFIVMAIGFLLLILGLAGCTPQAGEKIVSSGPYPSDWLLVSTDWLQERLADSTLRIVDMRAASAYNQGHIPGAVNVPVDEITATVGGVPFEYDQEKVQRVLNRIGLEPSTIVVIYDDLGMMSSGRMFWTLEYSGHEDVRVLNGGWNAWQAVEGETSTKVPEIQASEYPLQLRESRLIRTEELLAKLGEPGVALVDVRSPDEYTGEIVLAERGGHIPGAVNLVWLAALQGGDTVYTTNPDWQAELQDQDVELFKPADELQEMFSELGIQEGQEIITYCQTLWRGSHAYFLFRLMGYDEVRGYDGSWVEWGNNPDLPVVTGPEPGEVN